MLPIKIHVKFLYLLRHVVYLKEKSEVLSTLKLFHSPRSTYYHTNGYTHLRTIDQLQTFEALRYVDSKRYTLLEIVNRVFIKEPDGRKKSVRRINSHRFPFKRHICGPLTITP